MLHISHLKKTFGQKNALDDLSLSLGTGTVALLGQNGSGKSTLLRILATLLKPDHGQIELDDWDYRRDIRQLRGHIAYLPQELELPADITPYKLLNYLAEIRGVYPTTVVDHVLNILKLEALARIQIGALSGGERRLVGIAQAFLTQPHLLLLDEVFRGLSVEERGWVSQLIKQHVGLTIFSTHVPSDADYLAQSVIVLHQGQLLYYGPTHDLLIQAYGSVYEMMVPTTELPRFLERYTVSRIKHVLDQSQIRIIGLQHIPILSEIVEPSLEDAYLFLLKRNVNLA